MEVFWRIVLWKNVYDLKENDSMGLYHLGTDINNLPVGTAVASLTDGVVIDTIIDPGLVRGWGGRVIVQSTAKADDQRIYLLYAHLAHQGLAKPGTPVKAGNIIGYIGAPTENGGWFPHLHLQIMSQKFMKPYITKTGLKPIDAYGRAPKTWPEEKIRNLWAKAGLIDPILFISTLPE